MGKRKSWGVVILFTLLLSVSYGQSVEKFHALFISKFVDYINWPSSAKNQVIGVYGNKAVYMELKTMFERKSSGYSAIEINSAQDVSKCDVIYLASSKDGSFNSILSEIGSKSILLITESDKYAKMGADISFFEKNSKLGFNISPNSLKTKNLKVSSSLLSLGVVVD